MFLREYKFSADTAIDTNNDGLINNHDGTHALNTGRLLNGKNGGIATWGEVKAQAAEKLGLSLNDADVLDVPQLVVDAYGKFTPGAHGYAQVLVTVFENNGVTTRISTVAVEGKAGGLDIHHILPSDLPPTFVPLPGVNTTVFQVARTGHSFLNDIAHNAVPVEIGGVLRPDADGITGNAVSNDGAGHNTQYDNEMLDAHFLTGDGRGNENIGLTTVHTIFHSEHNRLVEVNKDTIIASGRRAVVNEWLLPGLTMSAASITQTARCDQRTEPTRPTKAALHRRAELGWRTSVPGGALRHRNAVPASGVRRIRPAKCSRTSTRSSSPTRPIWTRRSSPNSPTWSIASAIPC